VVKSSEIIDIIPQKAPMVMIGEHVLTEGNKTVSSLEIEEDNIFCDDQYFTEPGLIENMAQTAALRMGYPAGQHGKHKEKPAVGYIGAIKKLVIHFLPKIGQTIQTEIKIEQEIMNFSVVKGWITCNGRPVAECEMKIFQDKA